MGWQDDFKLRADLVQLDMETFDVAVRALGGTNSGPSANSGHLLKAAIEAGWLETPESEVLKTQKDDKRYMLAGEDVDKMNPGMVLWYGAQIGKLYAASLVIPPN